ncbi:hypothetical protein L0222_05695 [bacterium]|nr:hypothetical protein [bacterium]
MSMKIRLKRAGRMAGVVLILSLGGFAEAESSKHSYNGSGLELLFEAKLKANGEVKPYVETVEPFSGFSMSRDLIAQGEGSIQGPVLKGTITWSQLAIRFEKEPVLNTHVSGWITFNDGSEIFFNGIGHAARPDPEQPDRWVYVFPLVFEDADKPYEWLTGIPALWIGEFEVKAGAAHYRAYVPKEFMKIGGK